MLDNMAEMVSNTTNSGKGSEWFYAIDNERKGGVTEAEIIELIKKGTIGHGTYVWKKGLGDWTRVENTELRTYVDDISPPPLTGENVSNSIVWVLAFAPIIGGLLENLVAEFVHGDDLSRIISNEVGKFWYITLILNSALAIWDEKRIKKAGINTSKFYLWAWILVPVYLFKRSRALKQNLSYFIVWMVCFFIVLAS